MRFSSKRQCHSKTAVVLYKINLSIGKLPYFWFLNLRTLHILDEALLTCLKAIYGNQNRGLHRLRVSSALPMFRYMSRSITWVKEKLPRQLLFRREYCLRSYQFLQDVLRLSESVTIRPLLYTRLPFELVEMVVKYLLGDDQLPKIDLLKTLFSDA